MHDVLFPPFWDREFLEFCYAHERWQHFEIRRLLFLPLVPLLALAARPPGLRSWDRRRLFLACGLLYGLADPWMDHAILTPAIAATRTWRRVDDMA